MTVIIATRLSAHDGCDRLARFGWLMITYRRENRTANLPGSFTWRFDNAYRRPW